MQNTATIDAPQGSQARTPVGKKRPKATEPPDDPKRPRGRPSTNIDTTSFCCRAPLTMGVAYTKLARITGTVKPGTELLRGAEDHLLRMYRLIRFNPDSPLIRDFTGKDVAAFLTATEAYLKEANLPIPTDELS